MNKFYTLLACLLLFCSAAAKTPVSVIVHTNDDEKFIFSLTEKSRFDISDNEIHVVYPEGEYAINFKDLKKIEYSETSGIESVEHNAVYHISGNILTIDGAYTDIEISLFTLGGELAFSHKVMASQTETIHLSEFKGIYILKINGISQKIILK